MTDEAAGEVERLRLPLKGGRRVRLFFYGHLPTQGDIEKLIANLELNKDTFPEDAPVRNSDSAIARPEAE